MLEVEVCTLAPFFFEEPAISSVRPLPFETSVYDPSLLARMDHSCDESPLKVRCCTFAPGSTSFFVTLRARPEARLKMR